MDKNLLSRFIKGVLSTGIGNFIHMTFGFLGLMIAIRYVAKEEFGVFVLIQVIYGFFVAITSICMENFSVTKLITSVEDNQKMEVVNTAICYKCLIGIVTGIVILLSNPVIYFIFKSEIISQLLIYIPLLFLLSSLDELLFKILQGFHQYKKIAISQIIQGGVKFLLIVIFLVLLKMNVLGLIYAFLFSIGASVLFQYFVIPVKKQLNFSPILFKRIFRFGFPLGLSTMLSFIYSRIDRVIIGAMISPVGVAYYAIASKIPNNSSRIFTSFLNVFFPNMSELFAKKRNKEATKILNNSLRFVSFVTISAALIATLFQKEIILLLFSDRYLKSTPVFPLLMIGLSISIVGTITGMSLVAFGRPDITLKIDLLYTVMNVIGNLIMIPIFGFIGAAYTKLISLSVSIPMLVWFLKKEGVRVEISQYVRPFMAFGILAIVFLLIRPESIIIKLSFLILFLIICMLLSIIKKKDISILFEGMRPFPRVIK